jgi:hypothetical protein
VRIQGSGENRHHDFLVPTTKAIKSVNSGLL